MNFGEYLRKKGWTYEGLADVLGISKQAVFQWVNGDTKPSKKTYAELLKVLKLQDWQLPRTKPFVYCRRKPNSLVVNK